MDAEDIWADVCSACGARVDWDEDAAEQHIDTCPWVLTRAWVREAADGPSASGGEPQ